MLECHWPLIFLLVSTTYSYLLQCPDFSQRPLRAMRYCTSSLRSRYTCLYDTNKLSFSEQCNRNPDFVTPGEKYVITGNLRNVDCSSERYQPFRLWSNVSGECLNQKSLCEGEGQVIVKNGSLIGDRTCRCDYTKGYKFIKRPKQNCSCSPLQEDCSCYISKCPGGSVLTSDYKCVEEKHHVDSKCPLIVIERGGLQITEVKTNAENGKQLRTSSIAASTIILLILAYAAIVFFVLITERKLGKKKGISHEVENLGKPSIANNEEENSKKNLKSVTSVAKLKTNDETIISTHAVETTGLVRHAEIKQETTSAEENLQSDLNAQLESKDAALKKTKLEHKKVVELKDAKILELEMLLKERNEYMKKKEIEDQEKEAQNREIIRKLEMERRNLHNKIQDLNGNIRVFCRVRPLLNHEKQGNNCTIDHINFPDQKTIEVVKTGHASESKNKLQKTFNFDKVFSNKATQDHVFTEISQLVQSALDGFNVCIFAYGQTGSGKTYTMEGTYVNDDDENRGMIPRAVLQIFNTIRKLKSEGWKYNVDASCLEIYGNVINDLLCDYKVGPKPEIKDNNNEVYVSDLTIIPVTEETEVYLLLQKASKKRKVAETKSNLRSSRSHSVFTLKLTGENSITKETTKSTLNLVDLAGSERQKTSGTEGQQIQEAIAINLSLSTLGKFIRAIKDKDKFLPYRESKLTLLLHRAIGGNSKTLMFVNVSPKIDCVEETINSLKFATEANQCKKGIAQQNK
ncbi:carboxy-terminal kinesin 2-like [Mytilus californianus]|uniref:carboxy-terminal kinesin 2-like n=1 Tax=Mytilus californianus TaxID=6549 RepID=UPI002247733C|nr:carboxy-terminal kinesin 2-like [Mytilus californianus]